MKIFGIDFGWTGKHKLKDFNKHPHSIDQNLGGFTGIDYVSARTFYKYTIGQFGKFERLNKISGLDETGKRLIIALDAPEDVDGAMPEMSRKLSPFNKDYYKNVYG